LFILFVIGVNFKLILCAKIIFFESIFSLMILFVKEWLPFWPDYLNMAEIWYSGWNPSLNLYKYSFRWLLQQPAAAPVWLACLVVLANSAGKRPR